ncbi:MAG: DegQ family serine endoprotease [Gammaproteobacteria bacterium]|nr:DegQ family serine endoprotease [Gammaproteobacteria bacterium]MDH5652604.1 DegQ family serine endoprotease [Gammaproteobacteria bacterium]
MHRCRYQQLIVWLTVLAGYLFTGQVIARDLPDFTKLVEENNAAVVNISTTQRVKRRFGMPPGMEIPEGHPWNDLFRRFFGDGGRGDGQGDDGHEGGDGGDEFDTQSLGSGFVLDKDGHVLTNYHVVRDATEIIVRLQDRRDLKAKVVGYDERSDIALLKIDAKNLPAVKIGKSSEIKVGEWVMAIGSPYGFDHSVSVGVVSALGRNLPSESYVPFIQTDVAINPGNSGGPLFNLNGEVVGINAQIYSRTGGFMGLSFAIPIDVAMDVITQIKTKGRVIRGWLGIRIHDVNRDLAESFKMKKPMGAAVVEVLQNSPAEKAGIQTGDVVVKFGKIKIHNSADLPLAVGQTPVGSVVDVQVIREGKPVTIAVTIEELPKEEELAKQESRPGKIKTDRLGLSVKNLTPEERNRLGLDKFGIRVTGIDKGAARNAGIAPGDVILKIGSKDVKDTRQFHALVKKLPAGKTVSVLIQRGESRTFLALKVPDGK